MTGSRAEKVEAGLRVGILLIVGGIAGAAAFTHVHDWTMHNSPTGTPDEFGWANSVITELLPIGALLEIKRRRRVGQALGFPVWVLGAFALVSLTAQVSEARPSVTGWLVAALPALAFMALVKLVLFSAEHEQDAVGEASGQPVRTVREHIAEQVPAAPAAPLPEHRPLSGQLEQHPLELSPSLSEQVAEEVFATPDTLSEAPPEHPAGLSDTPTEEVPIVVADTPGDLSERPRRTVSGQRAEQLAELRDWIVETGEAPSNNAVRLRFGCGYATAKALLEQIEEEDVLPPLVAVS